MKFSYRKVLIILIVITTVCSGLMMGQATDYTIAKPYVSGIGVRIGTESGLSIKQFVNHNTAFEGILSRDKNYNATRITVLHEIQTKFKNCKQLSWFYGFGAHASFYRPSYNSATISGGYYDVIGRWHNLDYRVNYTSTGFDGVIGLEFQFAKLPFTLGLDTKLYIDFVSLNRSFLNGGFTLKYVMK